MSNDESGLITTGLHALGLPQEEIEALINKVQGLANRPAEDAVPGWEPDPPLKSDHTFTFGAGDETLTVTLPILGGDYYWSILLPAFEEWVSALYRGQALNLMHQVALQPLPFMLDLFEQLVRRRQNDRLKISFYETAAATFTRPETVVTPQFFAKCPPNQQMAAIRKLVEINRENFREWWAEMPTPVRYLTTSLRTASMLSIERLNEQLLGSIYEMTQETSAALRSSGGAENTGLDGSTGSLVERLAPGLSSEI